MVATGRSSKRLVLKAVARVAPSHQVEGLEVCRLLVEERICDIVVPRALKLLLVWVLRSLLELLVLVYEAELLPVGVPWVPSEEAVVSAQLFNAFLVEDILV